MKFTPNYTVSYHGEFHKAGEPFEIEEKDINEMSVHGVVAETKREIIVEDSDLKEERLEDEPPKRGRPRK